MFTDVKGGQHCFLSILGEIFAESGVVGRVVVVGSLFVSGIVSGGYQSALNVGRVAVGAGGVIVLVGFIVGGVALSLRLQHCMSIAAT